MVEAVEVVEDAVVDVAVVVVLPLALLQPHPMILYNLSGIGGSPCHRGQSPQPVADNRLGQAGAASHRTLRTQRRGRTTQRQNHTVWKSLQAEDSGTGAGMSRRAWNRIHLEGCGEAPLPFIGDVVILKHESAPHSPFLPTSATISGPTTSTRWPWNSGWPGLTYDGIYYATLPLLSDLNELAESAISCAGR